MWDIVLADQIGTSAWDVRENATAWDVLRYREWASAKSAGEKVASQRARARSIQSPKRPSRRGRRR
tara:strand:- start:3392 stop:3589 length:198 start_codon:yes stop_codon:yes gene_type:complete